MNAFMLYKNKRFFSDAVIFVPSGIEAKIIHSEVKYYAAGVLFEAYAFPFFTVTQASIMTIIARREKSPAL
jgi:hypothetical protein